MGKIVEFENVYIEYPDELEFKEDEKTEEELQAKKEYDEMVLSRTQKFSIEELQKKLEETQSLHL